MLRGSATDDGNPSGGSLTWWWSQISSKGEAVFAQPDSAETTVSFSRPGEYFLRLSVSDGQLTAHDDMAVRAYEQDYFEENWASTVVQTIGLQSGVNAFGEPEPQTSFTYDGGLTWFPSMVATNEALIGSSHARIMGTKWISTDPDGTSATNQPARYRTEFTLPGNATDPEKGSVPRNRTFVLAVTALRADPAAPWPEN